jgi:hypothetical protein
VKDEAGYPVEYGEQAVTAPAKIAIKADLAKLRKVQGDY